MNRRKSAIALILLLVLGSVAASARAEGDRDRPSIRGARITWPGGNFRELQSAIDAAPDGATVIIQEGVYRLTRPLYVRGKRLTLAGSGSGLKNRTQVTQLLGPDPKPVLDERGNMVLLAETVEGLINLVAADVLIRDMQLAGFDAGIVAKADERGNSGPTVVSNVMITNTGRGILSMSSSDLTVKESTIRNTRWNGISAGPLLFDRNFLTKIVLDKLNVVDPEGAGIYVHYAAHTGIQSVYVENAKSGGLVAEESNMHVYYSEFFANYEAGILISGEHPAVPGNTILEGNTVQFTQPRAADGNYGDGVVATLHPGQQHLAVELTNNYITSSKRAGVSSFGAELSLSGNKLLCNAFDLDGEEFSAGFSYTFHDNGQNSCGCPGSGTACTATSSKLSAPAPAQGLQ